MERLISERYCKQFADWLHSDRKEPPPCPVCAEASASHKRAAELRILAARLDDAADVRIAEAHGTGKAA